MAILRPRYKDAFHPVLTSSEALVVSQEQRDYIKTVLDYACSDSQFADKAFAAIEFILTSGSVKVPTVTTLTPGSATIGDPNFTLHVAGTNFTPLSQIVWNGGVEPTVYVSATELTTDVNMVTATTSGEIPVAVLSEDDVLSNSTIFVLQAAPGTLAAKSAAKAKFETPSFGPELTKQKAEVNASKKS